MNTEILITSPPDRERVVAEIWYGDSQLAELNEEAGQPMLEIYPNPTGEAWILDFNELVSLLERARAALRTDSKPGAK